MQSFMYDRSAMSLKTDIKMIKNMLQYYLKEDMFLVVMSAYEYRVH